MKRYVFADSSITKLVQTSHSLAAVMLLAKERAEIDFDISESYRSVERQRELYKAGKSQLDGINFKSNHNYMPSRAVDIYAYKGPKADYSKEKMTHLSEVIKKAADDLGVKISWGGDWEDFVDMPHYELV